jgi:WD40 repeat protein
LNADGSQVVAMGADNRVRLIDVESGEQQLLPLENICDATFTENDTELVLLARDGTLFRWNLATWTLDAKLSTTIERVCGGFRGFYGVVFTRDTDFTNDGAMLAAHARDREIYLIDTTTGETLATLERSEDGHYDSLKFSHDGAWLATGGIGIYAGNSQFCCGMSIRRLRLVGL